MDSQSIFPDDTWKLQTPQPEPAPRRTPSYRPLELHNHPAADGNCSCRNYLPPGQHNPFEHGVRPYRVEDFPDAGIDTRIKSNQEAGKSEDARMLAMRKTRMKKLGGVGGEKLLDLMDLIEDGSRSAIFTCGGSIPIALRPRRDDSGDLTPRTDANVQAQKIMTRPVTLRWGEDNCGRLLKLPITDMTGDLALQALLGECSPATFGRGGEDVYDESYRKARALAPNRFMTDFCPYETGIIDSVAQLLLPAFTNITGAKDPQALKRALRAELYKLNAYSAPSGLFKAHVDTPRSEAQVGSLVVCFPVTFEGGGLAVRHQGHEVVHDWTVDSANSIQWAAFYSDCEHEVLEVIAGNRITLTYNLFLSAGTGLLGGQPKNMQPKRLLLYQKLQSILKCHQFMPNGGYLGIHLTHSYPHTNPNLYQLVPNMLKGIDMAIYESVQAAALPSALVPISDSGLPPSATLHLLDCKQRRPSSAESLFQNALEEVDIDDGGYESYDLDEDEVQTSCDSSSCNGEGDGPQHSEAAQRISEQKQVRRQIIWINGPGNLEISRAFMAYGNQAELKVKYSSAALVIKIPSVDERGGDTEEEEGMEVEVEAEVEMETDD